MFSDSDDPMLDAFLDEVLNGRTPPDLAPRILEAMAARGSAAQDKDDASQRIQVHAQPAYLDDATTPERPPVLVELGQPTSAADGQPVVELRGVVNRRDRQRGQHLSRRMLAVAACVIGLCLAVGITTVFTSGRTPIARRTAAPAAKPSAVASAPRPKGKASTVATKSDTELAADSILAPIDSKGEADESTQLATSLPSSRQPTIDQGATPSALPIVETPKRQPSPDAAIVTFVNAEIARGWGAAGVKAAPLATDAEWCQRVFVRVLGRNPRAEERQAFVDDKTNGDKSSDRREKLVERLISDPDNAGRFARHWSIVWADALIGRAGGQVGSLSSREELEKYLRAAIAANKPFDQIARELLTASGSALPGTRDYNPAVNFLLDGIDANVTVPTSRVARVLLGHQLQCAQCHEHPSQGWSQEQYWALNSFFRQMRVDRQGDRQGEAPRLVNVDFRNSARGASGGEVLYETSTGEMKAAFPRFLDGTEIPTSGDLAVVDRRLELARLVVQSDDFPKAVVNHVWAQFFDYGFANSQDEALVRMAAEFVAHDYDLKSLIRWMALSDPFSRSNKLVELASKDMPEEGELPLFSRYYARPLQTAGVFDSLAQAARIRKTAASDTERQQARVDWLAQFNRAAGKGGAKAGAKADKGDGPSLMVKGSTSIQRTASPESSGLVSKIAASPMAFEKKIEHLFLAALARQPTAREQRVATDVLRTAKDDQITALADVWWALLNSAECVIDR